MVIHSPEALTSALAAVEALLLLLLAWLLARQLKWLLARQLKWLLAWQLKWLLALLLARLLAQLLLDDGWIKGALGLVFQHSTTLHVLISAALLLVLALDISMSILLALTYYKVSHQHYQKCPTTFAKSVPPHLPKVSHHICQKCPTIFAAHLP